MTTQANTDPMSDGQIAYEATFPEDGRVPFSLIPDWMQNQWHRKAEYDRARQQPAQESPQSGVFSTAGDALRVVEVSPQPTYIESSGRWIWPLPAHTHSPGCCAEVVTASREWWEYAPSEAKPHPLAEAAQLRGDKWVWIFPATPRAEPQPAQGGADVENVLDVLADAELVLFENPDDENGAETKLVYGMGIHTDKGWRLMFHRDAPLSTPAPAPVERVTDALDIITKVIDALDSALGDTDPSLDDDMTDEEVRDEAPVFWACQKLSLLKQEMSRARTQQEAQPVQGKDTVRMNWLESKHVEVRDPLLYGSRAMFHASPDNDDESDEPSDLRKQIDAALASPPNDAQESGR